MNPFRHMTSTGKCFPLARKKSQDTLLKFGLFMNTPEKQSSREWKFLKLFFRKNDTSTQIPWQRKRNGPHVHWARKPGAVIHPSALVATVLLTSGPQGIKGQVLNRFCSSSGRKHPSRSCKHTHSILCRSPSLSTSAPTVSVDDPAPIIGGNDPHTTYLFSHLLREKTSLLLQNHMHLCRGVCASACMHVTASFRCFLFLSLNRSDGDLSA